MFVFGLHKWTIKYYNLLCIMFSWQHTVGQRWTMQQQPKLKADIILSNKMWHKCTLINADLANWPILTIVPTHSPCHWIGYDCAWTSDFQKTKHDEAWLSVWLSLSRGGSGVMKIWQDLATVQLNPALVLGFIAHPAMGHHLAHSTACSVSPTYAIMDLKRSEGLATYLPMACTSRYETF